MVPLCGVDQVDSAEVPAGVAHGHFAEVAVPSRNLEPHALERDRAIALTLTPLGFQAKRVAKRLARRALAEHVRRLGETLDRRAGGLAVHGAVVLDFHPRLGRFVENSSVNSATPSSIFISRPSSVPQNASCLPF